MNTFNTKLRMVMEQERILMGDPPATARVFKFYDPKIAKAVSFTGKAIMKQLKEHLKE